MDAGQDRDLIVIGGGPAGAAAAIVAAGHGLRVTLCDRGEGRDKPGEALQPGIAPLLDQLGVGDRLDRVTGARHDGVWIAWGGPLRFEAFGADDHGPWRGYQVRRRDFDTLLVARAVELGVELRQPCTVRAPLLAAGRVIGVETDQGRLTARLVIDASGPARWLSRHLKLTVARHSPPLRARYGYVGGDCPGRDEAPALIADAQGWRWSALIRPGVYQWTRLVLGESVPEEPDPPAELRDLTPLGPTRGADVSWRLVTEPAGPGWLIAGDAAARLDPASAQGVLKAIMAGMMAGHSAHRHLNDGVIVAPAYGRWLRDRFTADALALAGFYRQLGAEDFG